MYVRGVCSMCSLCADVQTQINEKTTESIMFAHSCQCTIYTYYYCFTWIRR